MADGLPDALEDALGPVIKSLIGDSLKKKLRMANNIGNILFDLVARAYDEDPPRTQEVLKSDRRFIDKVADLNDIIVGEGEDGDN